MMMPNGFISGAPLSPLQLKALRFVAASTSPPSYREIGATLGGIHQGSVRRILDRLEAKGYIAKIHGAPRSVRVLRMPEEG